MATFVGRGIDSTDILLMWREEMSQNLVCLFCRNSSFKLTKSYFRHFMLLSDIV